MRRKIAVSAISPLHRTPPEVWLQPAALSRIPHMLDFRRRTHARNYLSRREQRRVFAWVMGIGLVVIAGSTIVTFLQRPGARVDAATASIDTRFERGIAPGGERDAVTVVKNDNPSAALDPEQRIENLGPEAFAAVRDDTLWIRNDEIDIWITLWSALLRADDDALVRRSAGTVGYVELFAQPKAYRGKVVSVRGSAHQATYLKAAENTAGVAGYYRVIIAPEGGPAEPLFLYVLALPDGFPVGQQIRAEVKATGIFFKRMVYPTAQEGELRRAPVVMAKSIDWLHSSRPAHTSRSSLVTILIAVGIVGLVFVGYWATRARYPIAKPRPADLPPIDDREVMDIRDALNKLAENDG